MLRPPTKKKQGQIKIILNWFPKIPAYKNSKCKIEIYGNGCRHNPQKGLPSLEEVQHFSVLSRSISPCCCKETDSEYF